MNVDFLRKSLNKKQTELREVMLGFDQHEYMLELFMDIHAGLHSAKVTNPETLSLEDLILDDMTEDQMRRIPRGSEHSVAWTIWHIARIEDIAMNILVVNEQQLFLENDWLGRLNIEYKDSGFAMDDRGVAELSQTIDLEALRTYRVTVGRKTRQIVKHLRTDTLKEMTKTERLQRVYDEGAAGPEASGLIDYWSKRTIAGLLLMPATRHNLVHLNEALKLKRKR